MTDFKNDFTSPDSREGGVSGVLVPDENGYSRAIFTETTREALKKAFKSITEATLNDYKPIDARRDANLKAYEAKTEPGQAIILPVVKRDVNQQLAWHLDAIFGKKPPFTATALDNDPIEILVDEGDGQGARIVMMPGDEYAKQLQETVNYYLLHKIGFKKTARTWILSLLQDGNRPPILKVIYEERDRKVGGWNVVRREDNSIERIEKDPIFRIVKDGEPTRIEAVPGEKFFVPLPYDDIQHAPFVFQEFEEDAVTTKDKIARGIYDFCKADEPDQNDVDMVISGCRTVDEVARWRADGRVPIDPLKTGRFYELWFDYPFAEPASMEPSAIEESEGEAGPEKDSIETRMVPFCAVIHAQTGTWMNCYENFRWDRKRPFFAGRQQDRPHSFSAYSTAENVAPFQKLMTMLFNAQLENIAVSNVATFGFRENSATARFFKNGDVKLRPGLKYPFTERDDIRIEPLGQPVNSMSGEIGFLNAEAEKMSVVNDSDRGEVPNRTPVGTVQAIDTQAKMQPKMWLDNIRDTISEVIESFVRTLAQFNPGGVRVPFRDPVMADGVEIKTVGFPIEWREGMFAFSITATGDEQTSQALITEGLMLGAEVSKYAGEQMQIIGASFKPDTPPPLTSLAMSWMRGRRNMLADVLRHANKKPDNYLATEQEIATLPQRLQEYAKQQAEKQAAQAAQQPQQPEGAMNGGPVSPSSGGGALPAQAGGPQPIPFVARQPDDGGTGLGAEAIAL